MDIKDRNKKFKFILKFFYLSLIICLITGCFSIIEWYLTPGHSFGESKKTMQLDYSETQSWFSLPEVDDDADIELLFSTENKVKMGPDGVLFSVLHASLAR